MTPPVIAEAVVLHLLLRGTIVDPIVAALHVYALIWLWGYSLGPRAYPHRVAAGEAHFRNGAMYRVEVPLSTITDATGRTERIGDGSLLVEREGTVLLPARNRVDLWLDLSQPATVRRPFGTPLVTQRLAVASDAPEQLAQQLRKDAEAGVAHASPAGVAVTAKAY